jgi:hypothetical protein
MYSYGVKDSVRDVRAYRMIQGVKGHELLEIQKLKSS